MHVALLGVPPRALAAVSILGRRASILLLAIILIVRAMLRATLLYCVAAARWDMLERLSQALAVCVQNVLKSVCELATVGVVRGSGTMSPERHQIIFSIILYSKSRS